MPLFGLVGTEGNDYITTRKLPSCNSSLGHGSSINSLDDFLGSSLSQAS